MQYLSFFNDFSYYNIFIWNYFAVLVIWLFPFKIIYATPNSPSILNVHGHIWWFWLALHWEHGELFYQLIVYGTFMLVWHIKYSNPLLIRTDFRFQMYLDFKILLNCPPSRETTSFIKPLFHYRRGGLIRGGLLYEFMPSMSWLVTDEVLNSE